MSDASVGLTPDGPVIYPSDAPSPGGVFGDDVDIETIVLGDGEPEVTVVSGIHGDEPSGAGGLGYADGRDRVPMSE